LNDLSPRPPMSNARPTLSAPSAGALLSADESVPAVVSPPVLPPPHAAAAISMAPASAPVANLPNRLLSKATPSHLPAVKLHRSREEMHGNTARKIVG